MGKNMLVILAMCLVSIYSGPVWAGLDDGLVAYYPFDGNVNDLSGNGNNGVFLGAGSFTVDRFEKSGTAANFTGNSASVSFVAVNNSPSLDTIEANDAVTISSWINIRNWYQGWNVFNVINKYNPSNDWGWEFAAYSKWVPSVGGVGVGCNWASEFNKWYHLALTYDKSAGSGSIYVNGALLCSTANTAQINESNGGPLYIGYSPIGPDEYSDGMIDDLRIYNRALSSAEIGMLYVGNLPPAADAGPDQTVNEFSSVTFNGSASKDPEDKPLTYQWTQVGGSPVELNLTDPVHPTFIAPAVQLGGETLTFQMIVSDGTFLSAPDVVNVTVKNVNHPPVADAGPDVSVGEMSPVILDGSFSYDSDGDALTYFWLQKAGPNVGLSDHSAAKPAFVAPTVGVDGATLTFELTVSDGIGSVSDTVQVMVENINHPPIATVGADQTRNEGSTVVLDGALSRDIDGDAITYAWKQLSGTPIELSDPHGRAPSFTAPLIGPLGTSLVFQLVVNDGLVDGAPAMVTVSVLDINSPPSCGTAKADLYRLWPPNHNLAPVGVAGVKDPDNDQVTITLLGVTQDELINGLGDGDTSPDAVIQGNALLIRAERAGNGNGRTYSVTFRADDSFGESCTGIFTVIVPHDRYSGSTDDGQLYDSLQP